jgi:subtilisin family serine protease
MALAPVLFVGAGSGHIAPARHGPHVAGEVLVKFKAGASQRDIARLNAANAATVAASIPHLDVVRLRTSGSLSEEEVAAAYRQNENVEFAELNYIATVTDTTPDDPLYATDQWGPQKVQAPAAWDITTGSASVVVAVVDTGVSAHPDLAGKVLPGYDFANNDSDPTDDFGPTGHGTKVAGIIGAATNNGAGMAAIAWQSPILPVKVCDSSGQCAYDNIAAGIVYAVDQGAKVINISLGYTSPSSTLEDAVNYAWNRGVVIVAGAGNNGSNADTNQILYPAAYPNVVAVGATGQNDVRMSWSSYGPDMDIAAPGSSILITTYTGGYAYGNGTSFAAPHVAGAAALLWASGASSTSAVVSALCQGADDDDPSDFYGSPGWDQYYGWGRLNIHRSLLALGSAPPSTPTPTPRPTLTPTPTATPPPATPTLPPATPTPTPAATSTATPTPAPFVQETFTGSVGTRGNQMLSVDHVITVATPGTISARLAWKGNGNLRLEVYVPNGALVASANPGLSPQSLDYAALAAGRYTLRIVAVTGSGKYALNALHP